MGLLLLTGPARTGKTEQLIKHLAQSRQGVIVVCATASLEAAIAHEYALSQNGISYPWEEDISFLTFPRLVASLWDRWGDERVLLSPAARIRYLEKVLIGKTLPAALESEGGKRLLAKLAQSYLPDKQQRCFGYTEIIRRLLDDYHKLINKDAVELSQATVLLAEQTIASPKALAFVGYKDFTPPQYELMFALSENTDVGIALDYEENNPDTDFARRTKEKLISNKAQHTVCTNAPPPDPILSFGQAQGQEAEVALMVEQVRKARENNPQSRVALLVRRLSAYAQLITRECEQHNVPFELDLKMPFGSTGFGAALLSLLRFSISSEPLADATAFMASPYSGFTPDEAIELESRWRSHRSDTNKILKDLAGHPCGAYANLIRVRDKDAHTGDWSRLIDQLYANGTRQSQSCSGSNKESFNKLQDAAAHKCAMTTLQELYEIKLSEEENKPREKKQQIQAQQPGTLILSPDPRISIAELLSALVEAPIIQTPRPGSTAVLIAEPQRIYGRSFDTVVVGGLAKISYEVPAESSLEARLATQLCNTEEPDEAAKERMIQYGIVAAARERLILVAQNETLGGEKLPPGAFLAAQQARLSHSKEDGAKRTATMLPEDLIVSQVYANPEKTQDVQQILEGNLSVSVRQPLRGRTASYDFGYGGDTEDTKNATADGTKAHQPLRPTSATALEKYAQCPYDWFLKRYLADRDTELRFDHLAQGSFAHELLKTFYEKLQETIPEKRITEDNITTALACYDKVLQKESKRLRERMTLTANEEVILKRLGRQIRNFLTTDASYAPDFIPTYFELAFGNDTEPPVDIGLPLPLRGSIDRIDVRAADNIALVIDYKASSVPQGYASQAKNQVFQGTLYRKVVEQIKGVRAVSHSYRSYLDSSKQIEAYRRSDNEEYKLGLPWILSQTNPGFPDETYQSYEDKIMKDASLAAQGLKEGLIEVKKNKQSCKYCLYLSCPHKQKAR